MGPLQDRAAKLIREWSVDVESIRETETSLLAFGARRGLPVVLKVLKNEGDEWHSGRILEAFEGRGAVQAYQHTGGAVLMERLNPGTPVVKMVRDARDEEAIDVLAAVIAKMSPRGAVEAPTVQDWAKSFDTYGASADRRIERKLVEKGREIYTKLCASQGHTRLLHGDLHHENVLYDENRGWLAIDPKGVIGEIEYEVGAAMRNPHEFAEAFVPRMIEQRLRRFAAVLSIDEGRALAWSFSQAVLSAIWSVEDGLTPSVGLAEAMRPMVG